jgi:hypothetical protein
MPAHLLNPRMTRRPAASSCTCEALIGPTSAITVGARGILGMPALQPCGLGDSEATSRRGYSPARADARTDGADRSAGATPRQRPSGAISGPRVTNTTPPGRRPRSG